jgi:hypothetical protein
MAEPKKDGIWGGIDGMSTFSCATYSHYIPFEKARTIKLGPTEDTQPETPMDKKTSKLVERIENAVGGKVAIRPEGMTSYMASWTSHSGVDIISGVFMHSKREAVKELLYELRRHGKRIKKIKG